MDNSLKALRNLALVGHGGSGKTSLAEGLLFTGGTTTRLGRVDDGNSVMDFEPEEVRRRIRPRLIFINKMDRERADFSGTVQDIGQTLNLKPLILQIPIGSEESFKGVVDLITQKAYFYDKDGKASIGDIPAELQDQVAAEREALVENVAEAEDALLEKYLEGEALTDEEIVSGVRKGTLTRVFVPKSRNDTDNF